MGNIDGLTLMQTEDPAFAEHYLRWESIRQASAAHQVAICGLMNAGKSALMNMLTGHLEQEYFATGASRTTADVQSMTADNIEWLDTPGIDASDSDDDIAWRGILRADSVLFAHTLRIGTLEQVELDFLDTLMRHIPDLPERLTVVLTYADSVEAHQQESIDSITQILSTRFAEPLPLFVTSSPRFIKGMLTNKPGLVQRSGIPQLLAAITTRVSEANDTFVSGRALEKLHLDIMLRGAIIEALAHREEKINALLLQHKEEDKAFRQAAKQLLNALRQRISDKNKSDI
jgi:tRNA U34 5-carboxymethylaminomethyl modifying GTPase MnmE/TrmE